MKYLILGFFIFQNLGFASAPLIEQSYDRSYKPQVQVIKPSTLSLNNGTLWKKADPEENLFEKWSVGDQLIVRWDQSKSKYVLQAISHDRQTEADLLRPSNIKIVAIDESTLTLSDGSSFSYIPFIDSVNVGDYVMFSLNENEQGRYYPYFIVGYSKKNSEWKVTGEIQARSN